jgi:hypothetical protein
MHLPLIKSVVRKGLLFVCSANFIVFGLLKLLQMHVSGLKPEELTATFTMSRLTFFYFGSSRGYVAVIGLLQCFSGIAFWIRRLKVFGLIVALGIQSNICLINIFYEFGKMITVYNLVLFSVLLVFSERFIQCIYRNGEDC